MVCRGAVGVLSPTAPSLKDFVSTPYLAVYGENVHDGQDVLLPGPEVYLTAPPKGTRTSSNLLPS